MTCAFIDMHSPSDLQESLQHNTFYRPFSVRARGSASLLYHTGPSILLEKSGIDGQQARLVRPLRNFSRSFLPANDCRRTRDERRRTMHLDTAFRFQDDAIVASNHADSTGCSESRINGYWRVRYGHRHIQGGGMESPCFQCSRPEPFHEASDCQIFVLRFPVCCTVLVCPPRMPDPVISPFASRYPCFSPSFLPTSYTLLSYFSLLCFWHIHTSRLSSHHSCGLLYLVFTASRLLKLGRCPT